MEELPKYIFRHKTPIQLRFSDVDLFGHVNNTVFFSLYDLAKAEARAHILEGLLKALDHIDAIIRLIRASKTGQEAKEGLMAQFGFTEKQAQAILDMRLQRLTGLERERLQAEYDELLSQISYFKAVLSSEEMVRSIIKQEIGALRAKHADQRRTQIAPMEDEIVLADLIQEEDMVVTLTHFGYVKRLAADTYRAQKRGGKGVTGLTTREEDFVENLFVTSTHSKLLFFTSKGRVFRLMCYEIPEAGRTAKGTAIVNLLQLDGGEKVQAVIPVSGDGAHLVMATRDGLIKRTEFSEFENMRASGLIAISLREEDELIGVSLSKGEMDVIVGTRQGMCIRFDEEDIRAVGRGAMGVKSIDLAPGDQVVSLCLASREEQEGVELLSVSENGYGKRTQLAEYRMQARGGKGIRAMALNGKTGELVALRMVRQDMDLLLISDDGTVIRMPVADVSVQGRSTQGVRMMRLGEGAKVVALAVAQAEEDLSQEEEGPEATREDE